MLVLASNLEVRSIVDSVFVSCVRASTKNAANADVKMIICRALWNIK